VLGGAMISMGRLLEKQGPTLYSPECVGGEFCEVELPLYGVLGSSASGRGTSERKESDVVLLLPALPNEGVELLHQEGL
jgi:hypothetical protein